MTSPFNFTGSALFARSELDKIVQATLPSTAFDNGHDKAIGGIITSEGAKFVVSMKWDDGWNVTGGFEYDWTGDEKVGVEVFRSWK